MHLELPKNIEDIRKMAHQLAEKGLRPISRKYDLLEHTVPTELVQIAKMMNAGAGAGAALSGLGTDKTKSDVKIRNGSNLTMTSAVEEMCWGDVGLVSALPAMGLGNSAVDAVATPEQKERLAGKWLAMAITEPGAGSDTANIKTTAHLDGDEWVINGEKIFITAGWRSDGVVVWATLDRNKGRSAIKSFVVLRGAPGMHYVRQEKKLGLRASDTACIVFDNCRIPKENLLGHAEIDVKKSFAGVMQTFDNTRPAVAAQAVGVARASLDRTLEILAAQGIRPNYDNTRFNSSAIEAELVLMEAELDAARLLIRKAAWMADNGISNTMHASMCKAKAGRVGTYITLRCVELCSAMGYAEDELLEKWARDSKIQDIYEGTQQIQLLIVARRMLGLSSKELK